MGEAGTTFEISSATLNQLIMSSDALEPKVEELLSADEIPVWLNESYIENILQKHHKNDALKVKCLKIKECGGKGENYASMMFRVGTYFTNGKKPEVQFCSSIVKTLPQLELALDKLGSGNYNVQNKEMEMYEKILPEFKRILLSIGEEGEIFPGVLAVDQSLDVIVMEDLMEKKFVMCNRLVGLNLDHLLMGLRNLAQMHAASAVVYAKNPQAFDNIDTGFFTRKTDVFHVMFETLCDALIEEVATWEGYEYYSRKLKNVRRNLIANAQKAFDCNEGEFNVLNHGDLWTNNLMYKYDEAGNPVDSVLLDFQFGFLGSPALDLIVRDYKILF